MDAARKARILIADVPEAAERLRACFADKDSAFVSDCDSALRLFTQSGFDALVLGLHFDESRMFELLRELRLREDLRDRPVICVRTLPTRLSDELRQRLPDAARAAGADAFIDLVEGAGGKEALCEALEQALRRRATL